VVEEKRGKIILVEDDDNFRLMLKKLIQGRFPLTFIEEAKEGNEAMEKIEAFLPDLIFMDIRLPKENGLVLTKKIKELYPQAQVIILTGFDLPEYREAALESGASFFASKQNSSAKDILDFVTMAFSAVKALPVAAS
jgi:DNA-binding NarL/FixJ family response regulator